MCLTGWFVIQFACLPINCPTPYQRLSLEPPIICFISFTETSFTFCILELAPFILFLLRYYHDIHL